MKKIRTILEELKKMERKQRQDIAEMYRKRFNLLWDYVEKVGIFSTKIDCDKKHDTVSFKRVYYDVDDTELFNGVLTIDFVEQAANVFHFYRRDNVATLWDALVENKGVLIDLVSEDWFNEKFDEIMDEMKEALETFVLFLDNPMQYIEETYELELYRIERQLIRCIRRNDDGSMPDFEDDDEIIDFLTDKWQNLTIQTYLSRIDEVLSLLSSERLLKHLNVNDEFNPERKKLHSTLVDFFSRDLDWRNSILYPEDMI